jgi:hypothetical protein
MKRLMLVPDFQGQQKSPDFREDIADIAELIE